jgi:hypothetical protein
MQTGGRPHGNPLLMAIERNGGRTGKFGVIFLLFIDEAQAAWDSQEHHQEHLDDTYDKWQSNVYLGKYKCNGSK